MDGDYSAAHNDEVLVQMARGLGIDAQSVLRALGGGWDSCEVVGEVWPVDGLADVTWFGTGEPLQVLAGVDCRSVVLARPVTRWDGVVGVIIAADLRQFAREDVEFQPELLADAVEELARASRRRFRWCRTCHTANAPETMLSREECMDCGERYRGVVY